MLLFHGCFFLSARSFCRKGARVSLKSTRSGILPVIPQEESYHEETSKECYDTTEATLNEDDLEIASVQETTGSSPHGTESGESGIFTSSGHSLQASQVRFINCWMVPLLITGMLQQYRQQQPPSRPLGQGGLRD
jgi:hypothetical protein